MQTYDEELTEEEIMNGYDFVYRVSNKIQVTGDKPYNSQVCYFIKGWQLFTYCINLDNSNKEWSSLDDLRRIDLMTEIKCSEIKCFLSMPKAIFTGEMFFNSPVKTEAFLVKYPLNRDSGEQRNCIEFTVKLKQRIRDLKGL